MAHLMRIFLLLALFVKELQSATYYVPKNGQQYEEVNIDLNVNISILAPPARPVCSISEGFARYTMESGYCFVGFFGATDPLKIDTVLETWAFPEKTSTGVQDLGRVLHQSLSIAKVRVIFADRYLLDWAEEQTLTRHVNPMTPAQARQYLQNNIQKCVDITDPLDQYIFEKHIMFCKKGNFVPFWDNYTNPYQWDNPPCGMQPPHLEGTCGIGIVEYTYSLRDGNYTCSGYKQNIGVPSEICDLDNNLCTKDYNSVRGKNCIVLPVADKAITWVKPTGNPRYDWSAAEALLFQGNSQNISIGVTLKTFRNYYMPVTTGQDRALQVRTIQATKKRRRRRRFIDLIAEVAGAVIANDNEKTYQSMKEGFEQGLALSQKKYEELRTAINEWGATLTKYSSMAQGILKSAIQLKSELLGVERLQTLLGFDVQYLFSRLSPLVWGALNLYRGTVDIFHFNLTFYRDALTSPLENFVGYEETKLGFLLFTVYGTENITALPALLNGTWNHFQQNLWTMVDEPQVDSQTCGVFVKENPGALLATNVPDLISELKTKSDSYSWVAMNIFDCSRPLIVNRWEILQKEFQKEDPSIKPNIFKYWQEWGLERKLSVTDVQIVNLLDVYLSYADNITISLDILDGITNLINGSANTLDDFTNLVGNLVDKNPLSALFQANFVFLAILVVQCLLGLVIIYLMYLLCEVYSQRPYSTKSVIYPD